MNPTDVEAARRRFFQSLEHLSPSQMEQAVNDFPHLSPTERGRVERRVQAMRTKRKRTIERGIESEFSSVRERAERAQAEADAILSELNALLEETEEGRVGLDDFERRYERLVRRLTNVQRNLGSLRSSAEALRVKEEDPEAYVQSLERKYPRIRPGARST